MLEVVDKIPKEIERVVLEEYYSFFQNLYGKKSIFKSNIKFTSNPEKLSDREKNDECFQLALGVLNSAEPNIKYLLLRDDNGVVCTIARVKYGENYVLIPDYVSLDYPTSEELKYRWQLMINYLEQNFCKNNSDICCEIPYNNQNLIDTTRAMGFKVSEAENTDSYRTVFLYLNSLERGKNELYLSRKQA